MQYKIHTAPIIDAFRTSCECPLCAIEQTVSDRLVVQYLGEAVMEPDFRLEVNRLGFCSSHLRDLFAGENKLGLALQIHTRTAAVIQSLNRPKSRKAAIKEAEIIRKSLDQCVICFQMEDTMQRYHSTVAQLYCNDREFARLFKDSKGFCLKHYAGLLEHTQYAKAVEQDYINHLFLVQKAQMTRLNAELSTFIDRFDYRSANKSLTATYSKDALYRAINKLKGNIVEGND